MLRFAKHIKESSEWNSRSKVFDITDVTTAAENSDLVNREQSDKLLLKKQKEAFSTALNQVSPSVCYTDFLLFESDTKVIQNLFTTTSSMVSS